MWDKLDNREHIWHQRGSVQSLVVASQGRLRLTLNHAHPPCLVVIIISPTFCDHTYMLRNQFCKFLSFHCRLQGRMPAETGYSLPVPGTNNRGLLPLAVENTKIFFLAQCWHW